MTYKIEFTETASTMFEKIHHQDRSVYQRILTAIKELSTKPFKGKRLRHGLTDSYSLRVGSYRVIYRVAKKIVTVYVLDIGHRKDIYQ